MLRTAACRDHPADGGTIQINVRFDSGTRANLESLAASSQRTLSQLVRYALEWWLTDGTYACPLPASDSRDSRHVNVRFPAAVLLNLDTVSSRVGQDRSTLIRCAVRSWLEHLDLSGDTAAALGAPSVLAAAMT